MSEGLPTIRLLSLWQPWATLVAIKEKGSETRDWVSSYKGWVAIHAAKRWEPEQAEACLKHPFYAVLTAHGYTLRADHGKVATNMPFGEIVALTWMADGYRTSGGVIKPYLFPPHEAAFGNHDRGRGILVFDNAKTVKLAEPIPFRGNPQFAPLTDKEVIKQLARYCR